MQTQAEKASRAGKAGRMREHDGNSDAGYDGPNNHDIKKQAVIKTSLNKPGAATSVIGQGLAHKRNEEGTMREEHTHRHMHMHAHSALTHTHTHTHSQSEERVRSCLEESKTQVNNKRHLEAFWAATPDEKASWSKICGEGVNIFSSILGCCSDG